MSIVERGYKCAITTGSNVFLIAAANSTVRLISPGNHSQLLSFLAFSWCELDVLPVSSASTSPFGASERGPVYLDVQRRLVLAHARHGALLWTGYRRRHARQALTKS
jgi:hypothetical protein